VEPLNPGERRPFMVVFYRVPENIRNYHFQLRVAEGSGERRAAVN
jgi:hypothetical protein